MNMKKLVSLLLALLMVMGMTTAWAEEEDIPVVSFMEPRNTGSITVQNPVDTVTYTAYKIFDLKLDSTNQNYAYTIAEDSYWITPIQNSNYFELTLVKDSLGNKMYVVVPKTTYNEAAAASLAATLKGYLEQTDEANRPAGTSFDAVGEEPQAFAAPLNLGYYFVTSSLGTLCSLDTMNPDVTISEKNEEPTVVKKVQEDDGGAWGDENKAEIGDTVNFKTTISAKPGAVGYVLHDKMSEGLTLNQNSIKVTVNGTELVKGTDYTVSFDVDHSETVNTETVAKCDFEIVFNQTYLDKITTNTDVVVEYSAILNEDAVISTEANTNDTKLSYGEDSDINTEWDHTDTYTFKFDLVKTDSANNVITGAKFELYDAQNDGNKIALVKEDDGSYRLATATDTATTTVIEAGNVVVKGLDANTSYWLEEIEAPAGYNMLNARVEVKIENSNLIASLNNNVWQSGGVRVENKTGTELPSTGGMGTTLLYAVGGVLVLVAFVLIVSKRRAEEN